MRKTELILPGLLLALAAVYGGFKGYVYYKVKHGLEMAAAQARPFARVDYRGIGSGLDGSVSVSGLEIRAGDSLVPVRVGELRLEGPGLGFLLQIAGGFQGATPPPWMRLVLTDMQVPDPAELFPGVALPLPAAAGEPCGIGDILGRLGRMPSAGAPLRLDARLGYELDGPGGRVRLHFDYQSADLGALDMRLTLAGMPQPAAVMMGAAPELEQVTMTYRPAVEDLRGAVSRCAEDQGLTAAQFAERLMTRPDAEFAAGLGLVPGAGIRQALARFLAEPGEIEVSAAPGPDAARIAALNPSPAQMTQLLGLRVKVNGQAVDDLAFELAEPQTAESAAAPDASAPGDGARAQAAARPAQTVGFVATPVDALGEYTGREVRLISPSHAQPVEGVLISVVRGEASVERRIYGGRMTVHIPLQEVTEALVMRRLDQAPAPGS